MAKMTGKDGESVAGRMMIDRFDEGRCEQVMHHGPCQLSGGFDFSIG